MENADGLLDEVPYPYWIDWAKLDRRGANFVMNAFYLNALQNVGKMMEWLKIPAAADYISCSQKLRQTLQTQLWDNNKQLFADAKVDSGLSTHFTEHANTMALSLKIAHKDQIPLIANKLVGNDNGENMTQNVLFMYWMAEGLFEAGYQKEALDILKKRYKHMIEANHAGYPTLWEQWSLFATYEGGQWKPAAWCIAQGENAYPSHTLSKWLLGLEPVSPGFKEANLRYNKAGIGNVAGKIPTPQGAIDIKWEQKKGQKSLFIQIPEGIKVNLDIKSLNASSKKVMDNGQLINQQTLNGGFYMITAGTHNLRF